jgi:hypothetical protein
MKTFEITKQMIDFQKITFDNTFDAVVLVQDQTEKMASTFLNQTPGFSKEAQKTINEMADAFKKGRDDFKRTVDESFEKMKEFFSEVKAAA